MQLATTQRNFEWQGMAVARERWLRPAVGFDHPRDVLKDPILEADEKRAILSSWASDASSVRDEPTLRWMLGTPEPVSLSDIRDALASLDRLDGIATGTGKRLS
jgi:hypothetical protein